MKVLLAGITILLLFCAGVSWNIYKELALARADLKKTIGNTQRDTSKNRENRGEIDLEYKGKPDKLNVEEILQSKHNEASTINKPANSNIGTAVEHSNLSDTKKNNVVIPLCRSIIEYEDLRGVIGTRSYLSRDIRFKLKISLFFESFEIEPAKRVVIENIFKDLMVNVGGEQSAHDAVAQMFDTNDPASQIILAYLHNLIDSYN